MIVENKFPNILYCGKQVSTLHTVPNNSRRILMSRTRTMKQLEMSETVESMHRTNQVNKYAFKQGNAAGAHSVNKVHNCRKQSRMEERNAKRGIYDE